MPLLSKLQFGSALVYSVRGESEVSQRSKKVCHAIKRGQEATLRRAVEHILERFDDTSLHNMLGSDVILVPTPRSALRVPGGLWVPERIAELLVEEGLGRDVIPCLERHNKVSKAARQSSGERPTAEQHFETIGVSAQLTLAERVTLIDDVVTQGATLLGAASRLATDTGYAPCAFALIRTMSSGDVDAIVSPCVGEITLDTSGRTWRRP